MKEPQPDASAHVGPAARQGTSLTLAKHPFVMKALVFLLLACLCVGTVVSADRPARKRTKGVELYSWSEHGRWFFVLLDGTNRLKSEDEVKKSPRRVDSIPALEAKFAELATGESVIWNFHFVPGFSFPDKNLFAEIVTAARQAGINLYADRQEQ